MHLELRCGAVGMCVRKKKEIWCTGVRAFQVDEQCAVNSTFLLSSSEAFSISIGNRISCTGAGYLTAKNWRVKPQYLDEAVEDLSQLTGYCAAVGKYSKRRILSCVSRPLHFGHCTSVRI